MIILTFNAEVAERICIRLQFQAFLSFRKRKKTYGLPKERKIKNYGIPKEKEQLAEDRGFESLSQLRYIGA